MPQQCYMIVQTIETDRYQPTSLRRGRKQALEKDLHEAYTLFSSKFTDPRILTIKDLQSFWADSEMTSLPLLRCEEEDQQEYYQVIFRILINDYFLKEDDSKKLFSIYHIYLFAYAVDASYERNDRPIHVTAHFISNLTLFLRRHEEFAKSLFMKIIKKIRELFVYSIKTGLRDPLIKKNGETFVRYPQPMKKIPKSNFSPAVGVIEKMMSGLENSVKSYNEAKEMYLGGLSEQQAAEIRREFSFDKNITSRLGQSIERYKADFDEERQEGDEENEQN